MPEKDRQLKSIPVQDLKFDPKNPRLPSSIDGSDESAVINWMVSKNNIVELMGSIGQKGYFPGEPLLVVPADDVKYEVIEGNRRLCAVKLLINPKLTTTRPKSVTEASNNAEQRPDSLPAIIYDNRDEILNYLGYRHITGVKEWGPLAKARYLAQLRQTLAEKSTAKQLGILARTIGTNSNYVGRLLVGLALYEEIKEDNFASIKGLTEDKVEFSLLTTALSYGNITEYIGVAANNPDSSQNVKKQELRELFEWIFRENAEGKTRLGESRNLKKLSAVVAAPRALAYFKAGNPLDDSFELSHGVADVFRNAMRNAKNHLEVAQSHIHQVESMKQPDLDTVVEIQKLARSLRNDISARLTEEDDF